MSYTKCATIIAAFAATVTVVWLFPTLAMACGAFVPLEENMESWDLKDLVGHEQEQMLYVVDDGQLTVYQGRSFGSPAPADPTVELLGEIDGADSSGEEQGREFAWLLPVPGTPEVEMAPSDIFDRLEEKTTPSFVFDDVSDGDCPAEAKTLMETKPLGPAELSTLGAVDGSAGVHGLSAGGARDIPAVSVVDSGEVGPFDHITITTRDGVDRPGERALQWLEGNDYALEAVDHELLDSYLRGGANLLAFRFRGDPDSGGIEPVAITVDADQAMSPIRLGAMGAADKTSIQVWVAAAHPVLPENYKQVQPNQGLIDWTDDGSNYQQIVAKAVREAGGQAFAVDATVGTSELSQFLISSSQIRRWEALRERSPDSLHEQRKGLKEVAQLFADIKEDKGEDFIDHWVHLRKEVLPVPEDVLWSANTEFVNVRTLYPSVERSRYYSTIRDKLGSGDSEIDLDYLGDCYLEDESVTPANEDTGLRDAGAGNRVSFQIEQSPGDPIEVRQRTGLDDNTASCMVEYLETVIGTSLLPMEMDPEFDDAEELRILVEFDVYASKVDSADFSTREWVEMMSDDDLTRLNWDELVQKIDEGFMARRINVQRRLASVEQLTALSTTIAPEDMTRDAYFIEVPDADPTPRTRRAKRTIFCGEDSEQSTREHSGSEIELYTTRDWYFDPPHGSPVAGHGDSGHLSIGDRDAAYTVMPPIDDGSIPGLRLITDPEFLRLLYWGVMLLLTVGLSAVVVRARLRRRDTKP